MAKHFYVTIEDKIFKSIAEASRQLNMGKGSIHARILSTDTKWARWRFLDDNEIAEVKEKDSLIGYSYLLTHKETGRFYVGSTKNIQNRIATHFWGMRTGNHNNPTMKALWAQDPGEDRWVLTVFVFSSRQEAYEDERERIVNADAAMLLNAVDDVQSPISSVMKRAGLKEFSAAARKRAMQEMSPERIAENIEKRRQGTIARWADKDNRAAWSGAGNPMARRIAVAEAEYGSLSEAAKALGVGIKTVWNRLKNDNFPEYRYLD